MSAFIVEDATINRVVSWLEGETMGNGITYGEVGNILEKMGYGPTVQKPRLRIAGKPEKNLWDSLAQDMFNLNCRAVEERYGAGEAKAFRPLDFRFKRVPCANVYQVLKSLNCWHYQCAEGNVPNTELFKGFSEIIHAIEGAIVSRIPEYDQAAWG